MLNLVIPESEWFDSNTNKFIYYPETKLQMEHSLIAISKWEAKWKKPFLRKEQRTTEEFIDYLRCMTINQNVDPKIYYRLGKKEIDIIQQYIDDPHSATTFSNFKENKPGKKEVITSELIYYWMVSAQIPFECEKWHLSNLMNLLRIADIKSGGKSNKMPKADTYKQYRALNEARRAKHHSKG